MHEFKSGWKQVLDCSMTHWESRREGETSTMTGLRCEEGRPDWRVPKGLGRVSTCRGKLTGSAGPEELWIGPWSWTIETSAAGLSGMGAEWHDKARELVFEYLPPRFEREKQRRSCVPDEPAQFRRRSKYSKDELPVAFVCDLSTHAGQTAGDVSIVQIWTIHRFFRTGEPVQLPHDKYVPSAGL